MNQDERVINLKDILAECFFKWRLIILAAILGCVAGLGITEYKTRQYQAELAAQEAERAAQEAAQAAAQETNASVSGTDDDDELAVHNGPYDEQMAEAKALLTQLQITKVDGLYAQYAANIQLRDSLADNINNSVIMKMDADNASVTKLMYTVTTDQDYIANNLNSLVVTDELMEKAAKILGEDISPKYLQDLFSVTKGGTGTTGDSIHIYDDRRTTSVIYLQAIAYTEEQADQITELMARSLESAIAQMKDVDPDIEIQRIGDVSSAVTSATIDDVQRNMVTELNNVTSQIYNIEVHAIPKLSDDEKTYYDLLVSEGKGIHIDEPEDVEVTDGAEAVTEMVTITPPSKAKYVLLGIIGAAAMAVVGLFLYLFLLSKRARSLTEIESGTGIPTLAVFERRLSKVKDPIVRVGIHVQTGDKAVADEAAYQPILAVRIKELLTQNDRSALYLYEEVRDGKSALCPDISAGSGEAILGGRSGFDKDADGITVSGGQPESSPVAMQEFLQADSVILVTHMYQTEIAALANVIELCKVHGKQILGNIVVYGE